MENDQMNEIKKTLNILTAHVVDAKEDANEIKQETRKMEEKLDNVLTNQDWMIGVLTRLDQERIVTVRLTDEISKEIENLKKRVEQLEFSKS